MKKLSKPKKILLLLSSAIVIAGAITVILLVLRTPKPESSAATQSEAAIAAELESEGYRYRIINSAAYVIKYTGNEKNVSVPSELGDYSVKTIEDDAFSKNNSIESVTLPSTLNKIGANAFSECESLSSAVIPESVTELGEGAFCGCTKLKTVVNSSKIRQIKSETFKDCTALSSASIPPTVKTIGANAFFQCASLPMLVIPDSTENIEEAAFDGCSGITSLTLGASVKKIGASAFLGCKALSSVTVPDSVTTIDSAAFNGCDNLKTVVIGSGIGKMDKSVFAYCGKLESVSIADGAKAIGLSAFYSCESIKSVIIPESVAAIGSTKADDNKLVDNDVFYKHPLSLVVYGKTGSYADKFAAANGITFRAVVEPAALTLDKTSVSLVAGSSQTVAAAVLPANATGKAVTWTSDELSVAGVSNGKIIAKAVGSATITAKALNGKTVTCKVTVTPPAAPDVSLSNTKSGLKATWKKVDNATSYIVHYKASSDKNWTTVESKDTSYIIEDVKSNKLYHVKVKSVGAGNAKSDSSKTKSLVFLGRVKIFSLAYAGNTIKAKWSKISGAEKFQVAYKKRGEKSFTTVYATKTAFELSKVPEGTSYTFKIRAQLVKDGSTVSGAWSEEKKVVSLAVPAVTARLSSKSNGVYVSWRPVKGASGYSVYYKESTAEEWTTKTTAGNSYTIKDVATGKTYDIRVCAFNNVESGALSKTKSVTVTGAPTSTKAKS